MVSMNELERRLTKVENETVAIFDEIEEFRRETRLRFDGIDGTLAEVLRRLPEAG